MVTGITTVSRNYVQKYYIVILAVLVLVQQLNVKRDVHIQLHCMVMFLNVLQIKINEFHSIFLLS